MLDEAKDHSSPVLATSGAAGPEEQTAVTSASNRPEGARQSLEDNSSQYIIRYEISIYNKVGITFL